MRIKKICAAIAVLAAGLLFTESEYEKKHFETVTYRVKTDKLDAAWDGVRMIFLSDLHENRFGRDNEKLKQEIEAVGPEMILIGGDMMVTKMWKEMDFEWLSDLLLWMTARYPVYYANGNHETRMQRQPETYPGWYEAFCQVIEKSGVHYLADDCAQIVRGESRLYIHGLDIEEKYYRKRNLKVLEEGYIEKRLGTAKEDGYHLLLAHTPLYLEDYAQWGADLVLSGHFHGGTIRIPGLGGVMSPQYHFFSKYNNDMVVHNGVPMIISAGLGTHSVNVRLNNPPQLVVIELKTEDWSLQEN